MAVADPPDQQQQPQQVHPQVQRLIDAAQTGATIQAGAAVTKAATTGPAIAVLAPAAAAAEIVSAPVEVAAHAIKWHYILKVLRALFRRHHADSASWLEKQLRAQFPDLDASVIRAAVERELEFERAFQRKALKRAEADFHKAAQQPTAKDLAQHVQGIINREKHYSALRERALLDRATRFCQNASVKLQSPLGAKWVLGQRKTHTPGCVAMAGKNWPWPVLDTINPPVHTGCGCELRPLGPNDQVPDTGTAMHAARAAMALEEAIRSVSDAGEIEAWLEGRPVRPSVSRALLRLQEGQYEETLHPRGRGGRWVKKLGKAKLKLKPSYEEQGGFQGKNLTKAQVHSAVKKVAEGVVDFYGGDKKDVEAHFEPDYLAANGVDARFKHPGELLAGINYGQNIQESVRSPDYGLFGLRQIAHEAAHSLSGTRPGPLPGFSQHFEEGGAEILSLWFWHHRAQELDHRDATKKAGGWTAPGTETLAHSVVYRDWVEEFMRRAASKVGWDRTAIVDEVERVMRGDHTVRLHFRDETDENFPLPKDLPEPERARGREDEGDNAVALIKWLLDTNEGKLQEAHWIEWLHPRGRRGQWVDAIHHYSKEVDAEQQEEHEGFTGEDFAKALDGFTHGEITALRANRTKVQNLYGEVWLNLHRKGQGEPVGLARVILKPPDGQGVRRAEYANIYLKEAQQNQGFGRAFTDHLFQTLRQGGVDRVSIEAVSVGGYAWARRGFVWTGDKQAIQRQILADAKEQGRFEQIAAHVRQAQLAELERKVAAGEFSSEAELAAFGHSEYWLDGDGNRTWLGKELMIGSHWKGERSVTVAST